MSDKLIMAFGQFSSEYDWEDRENAWKENSEKFRKFWNDTILNDSIDEINDAEIDEIVRILDMNGKGNTKALPLSPIIDFA